VSNYKNKQAKHFSSIQHQRGWTMWSLMFIAGFICLAGYIGLQLFPVYTTNNSVKNAMNLAIESVEQGKVTRASVTRAIDNQLYLDGAHNLLDYNKDLEIKRSKRDLIIQVNYERRVPLFFNLSLVATFENEVIREL